MLVYEEDCNIFPVMSKSIECLLDGRIFGLGVYHKEILLGIWRLRDML